MITATIDQSGNLALTLDPDSRDDFAYTLENSGYWYAMADAFESYSCNGSFVHFDASDGNPSVGLTSAPCIAESMTCDDDGTQSIEGRLWYFADYALRNDAEELLQGETVVYHAA